VNDNFLILPAVGFAPTVRIADRRSRRDGSLPVAVLAAISMTRSYPDELGRYYFAAGCMRHVDLECHHPTPPQTPGAKTQQLPIRATAADSHVAANMH